MGKKWGRNIDHTVFHEPDFVDPTRMIMLFSGYRIVYCIFSASGYTDDILKKAKNKNVLLLQNGERITGYGELNIDNGKLISEEIR